MKTRVKAIYTAFFVATIIALYADDSSSGSGTKSVVRHIPDFVEAGELYPVNDSMISDEICGAYKYRFDLTGGYTLYVFPDGEAFIEKWCDICIPKLVARGKWFMSAGNVDFKWESKMFESKADEEGFVKQYGKCVEMKLLYSHGINDLPRFYLVSEEYDGNYIKQYFMRIELYRDWVKIKQSLSSVAKPKNQGTNRADR